MTQFSDFFRHNEKHQDHLAKFSIPLKRHFDIDYISYLKLDDNGQCINFCNHHELFCSFWEEDWYSSLSFLVSPLNLEHNYSFFLSNDLNYSRFLDAGKNKFNFYHPFNIIRKTNDNRAEFFCFATSKKNPSFSSFYFNHLPLLNQFIDYFLQSNEQLIRNSESPSINLVDLRGENAFYGKKYNDEFSQQVERNVRFLEDLGVDISLFNQAKKLSAKEKEVIAACASGISAKSIAEKLSLSPRTVERHLENIKAKLTLYNKEELIECSQLLKLAGLINC